MDLLDQHIYWQQNLAAWSKQYAGELSTEQFDRPAWFNWLYHQTVGRYERRLMRKRYVITMGFIDAYVRTGTMFADLGCGDGIFSKAAWERGAYVHAVDNSVNALLAAKPYAAETYHYDLNWAAPPYVHVTLAMGLTPYLHNIASFILLTLPRTRWLCVHYLDHHHWANRLRIRFPFLNVRRVNMISPQAADVLYKEEGAKLVHRRRLGTGFIDIVKGTR